jgi:alcohol dehydrogenase (NADP+)
MLTLSRFVFPVPSEIPPAEVAPLFCAGLTVFSPLKANKVGPGSRVGVVGVGGLGHYAVSFARAMGATVTAISHSPRKQDDVFELGAKSFIVTAEPNWAEAHSRSLDLILCTSFAKDIPLKEYLSLLDIGGSLVYVGIPECDLPPLPPTLMVGNNSALRGSNTGSRKDVLEMLDLVVSESIRSWVSVYPMAQCAEVLKKQINGEARYRFVLEMDGSLP